MHKPILLCAISIALVCPSFAAAPKKSSKRAMRVNTAAQSQAAKPRTRTSHAPPRGKSRTSKPGARPSRRSYQQAPTPERYKEIQQVLVDKGYFKGQVNGQWGPDSVDSLRRFQAEQNLEPDGKLGALSLIALGLGPKRLSAQSAPSTPSTPPPAVQR